MIPSFPNSGLGTHLSPATSLPAALAAGRRGNIVAKTGPSPNCSLGTREGAWDRGGKNAPFPAPLYPPLSRVSRLSLRSDANPPPSLRFAEFRVRPISRHANNRATPRHFRRPHAQRDRASSNGSSRLNSQRVSRCLEEGRSSASSSSDGIISKAAV